MAGTIEVLGQAVGVVQTLSQAKEVLWDPLKVRLLDNVEEIRDALNEALQVLGSVRKDFEIEVEKNKLRVPSRSYVEWLRRVMEIEGQVRDLLAEYSNQRNEGRWFWFISPCRNFRENMKKMLEKVINLLQESKEIKDKMLVDRAPEAIVKRKGPEITSYETLRKPLEKILYWLERHEVKGIGIHGTVGIGKTTIMLNLNNHDQVATMFDMVIWLTVSKEGSRENLGREHLQRSIAQRLKLTIAGISNADEVAQRIATELKGKKYLLLLDDVKTYLDLDEIGIPMSNNGSKIVLTTRLRHVCENEMVDKAIKVAYLSRDEAWMMFQDVLGSKKLIEDRKIGPIAWQVCRECRGLPLLIEKVANTFRLKNTESLWSDGLNSWRKWPSQECKGIREMFELMRFCYNDLSDDRYKNCFLYGALYPEDSDINEDSLLECWAVEGLLGDDIDASDVIGYSILSSLKNVSLLEEGKSDYYVTMDKFIRQVALYILEENPGCNHLVETNKELREPPDDKTWRKKRRISLGDNELDQLPQSPNCSMLSTLFLQKNLCLKTIPPAFFKRMRKLRVLDLSHTGITSLPLSLSVLTILKVLHLNNCEQLKELPCHIVKLVQLESLDIHGSGITYIPPHIEKLIFLKRLWVSLGNGNDTTDVCFNYDMISKLSRLEELVIEVKSPHQLTNEVLENIMKEVALLQKFKRLKVCFSNRILDVIDVTPTTVHILVPEASILLSYIRRTWWKVVRRIGPFRFFIGCQNSEYSQNPNFVRYKKYFKYCNGADRNTPILEVLAEAEAFELVNHKDIKQLSDFVTANMNNIQGCLIEGCDAIETIMDTMGSELLPNLEQLFAKNLPMLKSIWKAGPLQPGSLTKLTTLFICNCQVLVTVFPPGVIQYLCSIQYLTIEKCNEVEGIIPETDAFENRFVLPKIKELILLDMKKLSSICAIESVEWPSLEKLKIIECPGLCRLPFSKGNSPNLECIMVEQEWWGALQWQNQEDKEGLQKFCIFRYEAKFVEHIAGEVRSKLDGKFVNHQGSNQILIPPTEDLVEFTKARNTENIWECLMNDEVSKIADYRMGGIDKTTIMKPIHNQLTLKERGFRTHDEQNLSMSDATMSKFGTALEGGVLSIEEWGERVTKRQKLSPEENQSLTRVTDEVPHLPEEVFLEAPEFLEEISLEKLEETPSNPRELEDLKCCPMEVPPTLSHHFSILHVLDLSYTEIKSLPQSISRLVALQKLVLRSCELLMELPPEIGELTNLEVLDLEGTEILRLPMEIAKLVNLTCLKVSFYGYASQTVQTVIPRGVLSNLSRLIELIIDVSPYGKWWDVEVEAIIDDLRSLKQLVTLKLYLPTPTLLEELKCMFPGLSNFRFTVGRHEEHFISRLPHNVEEEFNNLERGLKYINGSHIPNEITKVFKPNAFFLQRHWTAKSLSDFGHENINEVKFCSVMECNEFRTIIGSEQFYQGKDAIVLGSLERLIVRYLKNVESIWKGPVGKGSLSNLKSLVVHTCPNLTTLLTVDMLGNLSNLEELIVEDCPKIDSLVSLKSSGWKSDLFLPSLKKISLIDVPELVSISGGLWIAPKLERMVILYCPKLEKLSTMEVSSTELKVIKGEKEWWDALKWYESDLSTERGDYLARHFIPLRRDGDLMDQLTED